MKQAKAFYGDKKFIPTLNQTGYMTTSLDIYSQEFVNYAGKTNGLVLEIGAAYGVATLAALSKGTNIVCNDIEPKHLEIISQQAKVHKYNNITLVPGSFPDEVGFPENNFDAILISRVLHLFDGDQIEQSIKKLYRWLKPNGKLFIVADTPYLKKIQSFIPIYEERVKNGEKWPGLIENSLGYVENITDNWPKLINLFYEKVLPELLQRNNFKIDKISYFARNDYPDDRQLNGREGIGAIASKYD